MVHSSLLATILLAPVMLSGRGDLDAAGLAVTAPHGGYDQHTEAIARDLGRRLGWGWVAAIGYRSEPLRFWYDVNRPTERPWVAGGFRDGRETAAGRRVFAEYLGKVGRAARHGSARLELLVEVHGHARRLQTGHGSVRVEAIELATRGIDRADLWRLKRRYEQLVGDLPSPLRVPLAVDELDWRYEVDGWEVPFYFRASEAKQTGSLHREVTRRALHFELPPRVRTTARARRAYTGLLAALLADVARDLGLTD